MLLVIVMATITSSYMFLLGFISKITVDEVLQLKPAGEVVSEAHTCSLDSGGETPKARSTGDDSGAGQRRRDSAAQDAHGKTGMVGMDFYSLSGREIVFWPRSTGFIRIASPMWGSGLFSAFAWHCTRRCSSCR